VRTLAERRRGSASMSCLVRDHAGAIVATLEARFALRRSE